MNIDFSELERELEAMKPRSKLYEVVKAEMMRRGRWKIASRGKVFQTGFDPRRPKEMNNKLKFRG